MLQLTFSTRHNQGHLLGSSLFISEVNGASQTLGAPSLQHDQYQVLGQKALPLQTACPCGAALAYASLLFTLCLLTNHWRNAGFCVLCILVCLWSHLNAVWVMPF